MDKFKRTFSFRKKKNKVPEASKPHQWQEDEKKVRDGTCSFQVRYLGYIEVFESRGIHVCEEAVKALKARQHRSVWSRMSLRKKKKPKEGEPNEELGKEASETEGEQCKGKYQRAILYVSGDALRVVDEISKGLIVDQTIEKVSFCAPDRNHEKGFAYICREGTTRRWMCHGFLAIKESGERLSHAVGCAFAICLEKKQKREKETVTVTFNKTGTSFERMGSFRAATLTERMQDPQSVIVAEPVPPSSPKAGVADMAAAGGGMTNEASVDLPATAIPRPQASSLMMERQASFRGFTKLNESSPFKRQMSLRMNELPSTLDRQNQLQTNNFKNGPVSPIIEASPTKEQGMETISEMCQQLSQGLNALNSEDPFANVPGSAPNNNNTQVNSGVKPIAPQAEPIRHGNPWDSTPQAATQQQQQQTHARKVSDAELWLASQRVSPANPFATPTPAGNAQPIQAQVHPGTPNAHNFQQAAHMRSNSLTNTDPGRGPTLRELASRNNVPQFHSAQTNGSWQQTTTTTVTTQQHSANVPMATGPTSIDPFDAAWAMKSPNSRPGSTNPFQTSETVTQNFKVNL